MTVQTSAHVGGEDVDELAPKKRRKSTSPTKRALAECRKRGYHAGIVERWNQYARVRQDLFGCIDLIAITPDGILALQVTSGDNHASRVAKTLEEPRAKAWVEAGGRLEVWSYAKRGERGKRKLWTLRVEDVAPALRELGAHKCPTDVQC